MEARQAVSGDPRTQGAARAWNARMRAGRGDAPAEFEKQYMCQPVPWPKHPLDLLIESLPEESRERLAWSELRRVRDRVVKTLERIDEATSRPQVENACCDLAAFLKMAEGEWPKPEAKGGDGA